MPFDPDSYLQTYGGGGAATADASSFNPDEYLNKYSSQAATPTAEGAARAQRNMYAKNIAAGKTDMFMTPEGQIQTAGSDLGPLAGFVQGALDARTAGLSNVALAAADRASVASGIMSPEEKTALGYKAIEKENPGSYLAGQLLMGLNPSSLGNKIFQRFAPAAENVPSGLLKKAASFVPGGAAAGGIQSAIEGAANSIDSGQGVGATIQNMGKQFAVGAGIGGGLGGLLGLIAPSGARILAAKQQADRIDQANQSGIPLTLADAAQSPTMARLEKILSMVPFASGVMNKFGQKQANALRQQALQLIQNVGLRNNLMEAGDPQALEQVGAKVQGQVSDMVDQLGAQTEQNRGQLRDQLLSEVGSPETYEQLAAKGQQAAQAWQTAKQGAASDAYDAANQVAQGQKFPTPGVQSLAKQWLTYVSKLEPGFRVHPDVMAKLQSLSGSGNPQYEQALQTALSQIKVPEGTEINPIILNALKQQVAQKFPPGRTISQLNEYSTGLRQGAWDQYGSLDGEILKTLRNALDGDVQGISDKTGGELQEHLDNALSLTRERKQIEDSQSKILNGAPDQALAGLVKPNNPAAIKQAVSSFGSDAKDAISGTMGNRIMGVGSDVPLNNLAGYMRTQANRYGQETVEAALGPGSFKKIHDAADALDAQDLSGGLQNKFVKQAIQGKLATAPEDVAQRFVQPNNTQNALYVARSLGEDSRKAIAQAWLQNRLKLSNPNDVTSPSDITSLSKELGEPTMRSWFGDDVVNEWNKINKVAAQMGAAEKFAANSSGTGQVMVGGYYAKHLIRNILNLATAGAAFTGHLKTAGGSVLGPYLAAKLYTNPRNVRMFRQYLETAVSNPQSPNLGRLQVGLAQALRSDLTDQGSGE